MDAPLGDVDAALAVAPLIARGRAALDAVYEARFPRDADGRPNRLKPFGYQSMTIICEDDFLANVDACYRHVTKNGQSLNVLTPDGELRALLSKVVPVQPWRGMP